MEGLFHDCGIDRGIGARGEIPVMWKNHWVEEGKCFDR
jgi:hypothetical protein